MIVNVNEIENGIVKEVEIEFSDIPFLLKGSPTISDDVYVSSLTVGELKEFISDYVKFLSDMDER